MGLHLDLADLFDEGATVLDGMEDVKDAVAPAGDEADVALNEL